MKKKTIIILFIIILIGLVIGTMYLIDQKRMKDNKKALANKQVPFYIYNNNIL